MPVPKSTFPLAAQPKLGDYFDAWNSSSTGHQRAENRLGGSTGWRQSRTLKLSHQFKSGESGGKRMSDTIGAGSKDWDEKAKAMIPQHVRDRARYNVHDMLVNSQTELGNYGDKRTRMLALSEEEKLMARREEEETLTDVARKSKTKRIFEGLVIYINGSTHPLISDHKLKHLLAENGARVSIHLGRRSVTHVVLGTPIGNGESGAGGGLSGAKMDKEIRRIGGCGIRYVGVEW